MADPTEIIDTPFDEALEQRYLVYAMSTITARSLPDVRDGLKPVHRRLLWGMRLLRLDPTAAYQKCARVVGEVMGKYHPHGDQSIYDAMVRLAQTFSLRYPLVDGQGNFGNVDGDNAAAMRYTEARMTAAAAELMAGLDEGTVDFKPSYNGAEIEPEVFPGLFPNLLANGASGIAVGMATSIPPHNVAELIDAALILIDAPETEAAALVDPVDGPVRGPDFPTGGVLVDSAAAIREAYATGRGGFRIRARWELVEPADKRTAYAIIVHEIPYQVQKSRLIEQIADLINEKKLPILEDVRDESDETIRLVLAPRDRKVDPQMLMDSLFRMTDLEVRIPLNLNVLDANRTPGVMNLAQALNAWLEHQFVVLRRRSEHRLQKIDDRIELLEGYLIAYLNLDRVIQIIRTEDEPKPVMLAEFEGLTDRQAEAILNMRLRSLRRLEEMEIVRERDGLAKERAGLVALMDDPKKQRARMKKDLGKLRERYGPETALGARRTTLVESGPAREIPLEAMIEREPITVILSERGWIRGMSGHRDLAAADTLKFKEGDGPAFAFHAHTTDRLLLVSDNGRFYTLAADKLPSGRGFGEPVRLLIDVEGEAALLAMFPARPEGRLLLASGDGRGFIARMAEVVAETRKGRQVVNVRPGSKLRVVRAVDPADDYVAVIGENRKLVVFPIAELPELARGAGVQLQRYRDGGLSDAITLAFDRGLSWTMGGDSGRTRTETDLSAWRTARGAGGRMPPNGFPRDNKFEERRGDATAPNPANRPMKN
ncbi:DNA topoisomerase IV subunit A [Sphingomonas prati]|uniref:DNA topoisomerase 4 subunit A n=1 Tax=Sphingomonas prati TaxID=1843237 RepID=A0A7W9BPV9_9SPHN|nr:DNA topoisomerase IV subunit A [Sphingomonas prati]MBB5727902.1 topoisomerase-4 subunit A [Sphingomonas prati]GGE81702.1 DNA topoisomerase 4 subunit A [Sphingomonas prati]